MSSRRPAYSALSSESRVQILHELQTRPARTIDDLVASTELHPNTVREHIKRLLDDGYIVAESESRSTRGRPRIFYSAATGVPPATSTVAEEKVCEAAKRGDLMRRVMPDAGDADLNTDELHQLDALVEDLMGSGFDPLIDTENLTIDLSPCAHLVGADGGPSVRCSVHLTLLQSIATQASGPLDIAGLRPVTNTHDCIIQLKRRTEEI